MVENLRPFHSAFPVKDLKEARDWYTSVLGCSIGRESSEWIDINMFDHQIVTHLSCSLDISDINEVDSENVPKAFWNYS